MGETTNKGETTTNIKGKISGILPQSRGQQRVQENNEVWTGPLAGAGCLNKSNTHVKCSMQGQKNTTHSKARQGCLIYAVVRVRSEGKKNEKKTNSRLIQNPPPKPQQHDDRGQLETAYDETSPMRLR